MFVVWEADMTTKRRIDVSTATLSHWISETAWKRAGFADGREAVYDAVYNLSIEERVDLLTEKFIYDLAVLHFGKKNEFLRKLGHKTWVDADEVIEYAKETFQDTGKIEWNIQEYTIQPHYVDPKTMSVDILNAYTLNELRKQQKGKS